MVDAPEHLPEALKDMYVRMQHGEKFQRAQGAEERAVFAESAEQLRAKRRSFGDLPVIVLSRSAEDRPLRDWETEHLRKARYQMWLDLHRGIADASSRGEQRIVPNSDHMLTLSQPDAVVTAVRDVLARAAERVVSDPVYTAANVLVDVEAGRKLNLHCTGTGTPVVLFESGLGDGTKAWGLVQPEIAKHTTACSYNRAGLGFSDAANRPGTGANAVRDLQNLLKRAKLAPPYVLVGHSYGAMNAKLFAATHPSNVAGLVLVDPSHEDMGSALFALDPPSHLQNKKYLSDLKRCLSADQPTLIADPKLNALCVAQASPRYSQQINAIERLRATAPSRVAAWISEMTLIWTTSAAQVRSAKRNFGDMPLVLLSKSPTQPAPGESIALRTQKNLVLSKQREQTVARSSRGRQVLVRDSGHYIQLDQPKAVIDAVLQVIWESGAKPALNR